MSCSHVTDCKLFAQFAMNPALELWKMHYCEGKHKSCVRYRMSNAGQPVPMTLLPNGRMVQAERSSEEVGATTLFNAVLKNRKHMIGVLIRAGVDVNVLNIEGMTPLMAAASNNLNEMAKLLLEHGADPLIVDAAGETAYDIALRMEHTSAATVLQSA
jgi:Ankyrin repeats (many copies)